MTFREAYGILLGPSLDGFGLDFGNVLEAKIHANIDPDENV